MKVFSILIREARIKAGLKIRDVAEKLNIDAAMVSRFESGVRLPARAQVHQLADILNCDEKSLMVSWLSSRIMKEMGEEPYLVEALMVAEQQARYYTKDEMGGYPGDLKKRIKEIDRLKKELNAFRNLDSFRIAEALELEYTYHSNKIEGNTLTLQETELVVNHGLTISGKSMREHLEAINHSDAIAFVREMVKEKKPINERMVLQLHTLVLRGIDRENAGRYRQVQVRISGSTHIPPDVWQVPIKMEELFSWYHEHLNMHPVLLAAEMHERLVSIHPFIDGNGRTSRLLMNLILLQHGYAIATLKGDFDDRMKYYDCLEMARGANKDAFLSLIAETELRCLKEYLQILKGSEA